MHKGRMDSTHQYSAREKNCDLSFLPVFQMLMSDSLQVFITYFCLKEKKEMEENRLFSWCCISPRTQLLLRSLAFRLTECMRVKRMCFSSYSVVKKASLQCSAYGTIWSILLSDFSIHWNLVLEEGSAYLLL